jgi:ATP-dependent Clp protease ATP-binding subunit ClpX
LDNIKLEFTEEALELMAENTLKLKTGARGLHTEIERVLMPHMYHVRKYRENNITELNIDEGNVLDPKPLI